MNSPQFVLKYFGWITEFSRLSESILFAAFSINSCTKLIDGMQIKGFVVCSGGRLMRTHCIAFV